MTYEEALDELCIDCEFFPCREIKADAHCKSYNYFKDLLDKQEEVNG